MGNLTNKNCINNEFFDPNSLADNNSLFNTSILAQLAAISKRLGVIEDKLNIINSDKVCPSTDKWKIRKNNINECIDMMDWEKIHNVMKYLGWQWAGELSDGSCGTPSIESLISHTRNYLERCFKEMDKFNEDNPDGKTDSYSIYTGGIKVRTFTDNNCEVYFILSDYSTFE